MKFVLTHPNARLPVRGTPHSAGLDVFAAEDTTIGPWSRQLVSLGLSMAFRSELYVRVAPRSSLAMKGIDVAAGVIDSDYRGDVKVLLVNNSPEPFYVTQGAKIAQLIPTWIDQTKPVQVDSLDETQRGAGGFGSTGQ